MTSEERTIPINAAMAYAGLADRLMPLYAKERQAENRARAAAADADFLSPDWSNTKLHDVMPAREAVALACGINRRYAWTVEHQVGDGASRSAIEGARDLLKFVVAEYGVTPKTGVSLKRMAEWMRDAGLPLPTRFPGAAPVEAGSQPAAPKPPERVRIVRAIGRRRLALAPAIEAAQLLCTDKFDTTSVWAELQVLAKKEKPPAPLVGATGMGLKYLDNGVENNFTRKQLSDYLGKRKMAL